MSSWGDTVKLKVTGFDKTEKEARTRLPNLSYEESWEEYYPQTDFTWDEWSVINEERNTTTIFTKCYYTVITALMNNLEKILVDGRNAPYEDCFQGHYLREPGITGISYKVKEIDNKTGNILFQQEIDAIPNVVHDVNSWEQQYLKEPKIIDNKQEMIELMELNPGFYELASESLKEDGELAMMAIEGEGLNYRFINSQFQNRRDFQLAAITKNSSSFHLLPKEVQSDYSFLIEACKRNRYCLNYVSDEEIKDRIEKDLGIVKKDNSNVSNEDDLPF